MKTHKHIIRLSQKELIYIQSIIRRGKHSARVATRARILLLSHKGKSKTIIATQLDVNASTVQDVRNRYQQGRLKRALYDAPRPGQPQKITNTGEAHLIALATSTPPEGATRWTLELLKERMIQDGIVKKITTVALWKRLNQRHIKPWREKNVVYSEDNRGVHPTNGRHP